MRKLRKKSGGRRSGEPRAACAGIQSEAIDLAKHTQHHLLLANAYLWQGLTQCNSFFDNPEAARASYDLARASCGANQPDNNMLQDLQTLSAKILRKGSVHPALKAWSQGAVGEKTFRQISDEFAEIVIARVWEREGRKVSRAAARLSISPKKCGASWPGWGGKSRGALGDSDSVSAESVNHRVHGGARRTPRLNKSFSRRQTRRWSTIGW